MDVEALSAAVERRCLLSESSAEVLRLEIHARLRERLRPLHRPADERGASQTARLTDAALYHAIRAGDMEAFSTLYDRYSGPLLGYALQKLERPDAEEAIHDTFMRLLEYQKVDPTRLRTFLFRTLRGKIIDQWRKNARQPETEALGEVIDRSDLERLFARHSLAQAAAIIEGLPVVQQEVVLMTMRGHTSPEIGRELNLTPAHVRKLLQLARRAIRARMPEAP